ncbi:MAG: thioredoxin fold domain-containing protein [Candidatus Binatia bacterium]
MDAVTYPQDKVSLFISDHFVPVKIHTDDHPELTEKYRVPWTPTFVVLDADGTEHYRETGYLPPDDFLAHMNLALGRAAFEKKDFSAGAGYFQTIVNRHGASETVPEALYFLGVCKNRMSGGTADQRRAIWKRLMDEHPKSDWAKKASFAFE